MSMWEELRRSDAFEALRHASARLGSEPLQVQGPGGNTSLKADGAMWIKASGTWLSEALTRDIMVPVDLATLDQALAQGRDAASAVPEGLNPAGLRPSIETAVHAVCPWPIVLHTHCVATIAVAARADAAKVVADRLDGLDAICVPYIKPGYDLAREIAARARPETRVIVLGNHGLIACGPDVGTAEALLREVSRRLEPSTLPDDNLGPTEAFSAAVADAGWQSVDHPPTHAIAIDPRRLAMAGGGSLYPDHVIFLGPGVVIGSEGAVQTSLADASPLEPARRIVVIPGQGVAIPADPSPALLAMSCAIGDVLARIASDATLTRMSTDQEAELLNWDAEKYRQSLAQPPGA